MSDPTPDFIANVYFSDYFGVHPGTLSRYGAFNISLMSDLPIFIDPFLLFNSRRPLYKKLHEEVIDYLRFLCDKSPAGALTPGLLREWFTFSEVRQTWTGFSKTGNRGSGLGGKFAAALHRNLGTIFTSFGNETVTQSSHMEKLCLIRSGVGKDNVSDFATNLIKHFLAEYTQDFAQRHIPEGQRRHVPVNRAAFNYETETWETREYELPWFENDYVLLVPVDLLTKEEIWINRSDLVHDFERIANGIPNEQLRARLNNHFLRRLSTKPTDKERREAANATIEQFPEVIEYFIREKEAHGDTARAVSHERIEASRKVFVEQVRDLIGLLYRSSQFYDHAGDTLEEARARVRYFKHVVEHNDGYKVFYGADKKPIEREGDAQIMFRFVWQGSPSAFDAEVNNGRGPADFKVSRGSLDATIIEFKLASNKSLKKNLKNQAEIYARASNTKKKLKVILFFTLTEHDRVRSILNDLGVQNDTDIVLVDARRDNKPSASKADRVEID